MSEDIARYEVGPTDTHTTLTDGICITAFAGGDQYGYQFTFESKAPEFNLHYFCLSGAQIEDLYRCHLERKLDGLEQMRRVATPKCMSWEGKYL